METLVATSEVQEGAGWGRDPLRRGVLTRWVGEWQRTPTLRRGTRCPMSPLSPVPCSSLWPFYGPSSACLCLFFIVGTKTEHGIPGVA